MIDRTTFPTRRTLGALAGSVAAVALMAGPAAAQESDQLNVYNWSDYIGEDTIANFEEEFGIEVSYDVYDNNETVEAKLLAGNSGYDIVVPTAMPFLARLIQAGALQPLDKSKIPNLENLDPALMERVATADPGNEHGAIYQWGTNGIGVNVDMVEERLGEIPSSWDLIFDPETVAKLADCGVTILDSADEVMGVAINYLGGDPHAEDTEMLDRATEHLMHVRPHVRYFHSSQYINDLANGEICVAMGFSGDIFIAADRAAEADNGVDIRYIIPEEGTLIWFDMMAIPADAPHPDAAHKWIDYILRPEVMAGITNYVWYANAVPDSLEMVDEEIKTDPAIFPGPEIQESLFAAVTKSPRYNRQETRAWTRVRTGQ
ncbi:MAG: polyamine ABC transporter substrate-binding protein [Azospirillaceae bacterium]